MNTENNGKIIENNIFRLYTAYYRYKILLYICTYVLGNYKHTLKMKKIKLFSVFSGCFRLFSVVLLLSVVFGIHKDPLFYIISMFINANNTRSISNL